MFEKQELEAIGAAKGLILAVIKGTEHKENLAKWGMDILRGYPPSWKIEEAIYAEQGDHA